MKFPTPMRSGITLIELLVVMIILTILVAAAIPLMAPSVETRRIREAARGISTFLSGARSRAIEIGRPVGVTIERMENEPAASMALFIAEMPPPFAGYLDSSAIRMQRNPVAVNGVYECLGTLLDPIPDNMVRVGDTLRVDYQGHRYVITGPDDGDGFVDTGSTLVLRVFVGTGALPWPTSSDSPAFSGPMPYQIYRQPVRSSAAPYQLPEGAVIDLVGSGVDSDTFHDPGINPLLYKKPITITFTPNGSIEGVYHEESDGVNVQFNIDRPTSGIFLLVGKPENVGDPAMTNWRDPNTLWVGIGSRTGQVGVTENNANYPSGSSVSEAVQQARLFARDMRGMGGN